MGQAKQRGSFEERRANPQGYPAPIPWTEEQRQALVDSLRGYVGRLTKGFFEPMPKRKPKVRTRLRVARTK